MDTNNEQPKKINENRTLSAMIDKQKRLSHIKERYQKKQMNSSASTGIQLLYGTLKNQNQLLLNDITEAFQIDVPSNSNLTSEFIKPPYLIPKIVSHRIERTMNIV